MQSAIIRLWNRIARFAKNIWQNKSNLIVAVEVTDPICELFFFLS